ncbi:MAG: MarR family winged helix-turn-helix transcriptional regulator [Sporichthyaceae bacterium]
MSELASSPTSTALDGLPERVNDLYGRAVDAVLKRNGLRARHWHVLHVLAGGPLDRAQVAEAMLAFWVEASVTQTDVVDDLVRRDWVATDGSSYSLTAHGTAAVARIQTGLDELSTQSLAGLSPDAVATARAVLDTMRENLEKTLPESRR